MAITVITGKPGSGKSLLTLQSYILPALLSGRVVYHNIPGLDYAKIAYHLRFRHKRKDITLHMVDGLLHDYSFENLSSSWDALFGTKGYFPGEMEMGGHYLDSIPNAPSGSLIVLDEAQKKCYINSKEWRSPRNMKFFEYCTTHRKSKHEVLIITQDDSNIDGSVNGIREEFIFLFRQERLGFLFRNRVSLRHYLGHQTLHQKPYATSAMVYDKSMYGLYESYSVNDGGKEVRRTRNIFFNPKLIAFFLFGAYVFFFGFPLPSLRSVGKVFSPGISSGVSASASSSSFSPSFFLGDFEDYHCSDKIYVLRAGGKVDTIPPRFAPGELCPRFDYIHSIEVSK